MANSFIYQPHIRTAEGVLTPDLVVDSLALAQTSDSGSPLPVPVNLLTTATEIQQLGSTACGTAALVLVSGGQDPVATVGSAHWDPALGDSAAHGHQVCAKPICREALRVSEVEANPSAFLLRTLRVTKEAATVIGELVLSDVERLSAILSAWSGAGAPARSVLFISAGHRDPDAADADGYVVELENGEAGTRLRCAYTVRRLAAPALGNRTGSGGVQGRRA